VRGEGEGGGYESAAAAALPKLWKRMEPNTGCTRLMAAATRTALAMVRMRDRSRRHKHVVMNIMYTSACS
jgi:hypothetical protein